MAWEVDYKAEFARREFNMDKASRSPRLQRGLWRYYADHPIEFIEDYCYTYDPRRAGIKTLPFILFPRQREFIQFLQECVHDRESGLVEKCRDGGLTWLCAAFALHQFIFNTGASMGFGSRKENLVDKIGDPDSIFEKIRIMIRYLPPWLLPLGFTYREHMTFMKILNPNGGGNIKGEAGDNIGRGGRSLMYFKDESAHYERPELIEAALGDNTDIQIDISSVNGSANIFYRRRMAGEIWEPGKAMTPGKVRVFVFDWRDDPRKTQEWYERRREKALNEGLLHVFAQEVDRDYAGSVEGIIIPAQWVNAIVDAHIHLGFDEDGENIAAQDVADGGGDRNALACRRGVILRHASQWGGEAGDAARIAVPICIEQRSHELYYDSIGVGAGFKTETNRMVQEESWPQALRVMPWTASAKPLDPDDPIIPGDDQSPTNDQQYANLKAQAWFRFRSRCYKTYRAVVFNEVYDPAELVSIDSTIGCLHELKMQLSQPVKKTSMNGKTMVDKTPDGALSPNLAEATVMCYNPTREASIFDVL